MAIFVPVYKLPPTITDCMLPKLEPMVVSTVFPHRFKFMPTRSKRGKAPSIVTSWWSDTIWMLPVTVSNCEKAPSSEVMSWFEWISRWPVTIRRFANAC